MKNRFGCTKGYTFTEVLITLAILAIVASIAIPAYTGYVKGTKRSEAKVNIVALKMIAERYYADYNQYCRQGDEPCTGDSYDYKDNDDGTVNVDTLKTGYLASFTPKSTSSTKALLYDYNITFTGEQAYVITATPVAGRGPAGTLCMNQDGEKNLGGCIDW